VKCSEEPAGSGLEGGLPVPASGGTVARRVPVVAFGVCGRVARTRVRPDLQVAALSCIVSVYRLLACTVNEGGGHGSTVNTFPSELGLTRIWTKRLYTICVQSIPPPRILQLSRMSRSSAFALSTACIIATVSATGRPESVIPSRSELLDMLANRVPQGVPADFECGWRALAYQYAQTLQPFRSAESFAAIHDGLELASLCNQTFKAPLGSPPPPAASLAPRFSASTLYVDAVNGNDANSGTEASPLQHIAAAVTAARKLPGPNTIVLRGNGVHRVTSAITLTVADSGLSFVAFPGEAPVVSGGQVRDALSSLGGDLLPRCLLTSHSPAGPRDAVDACAAPRLHAPCSCCMQLGHLPRYRRHDG
jgi:hypothetical protein